MKNFTIILPGQSDLGILHNWINQNQDNGKWVRLQIRHNVNKAQIWFFISTLHYSVTSLGLLALLGVPFLWSVRLNNSYVRSIQWINTLELEKKSSVTVTFTLFVNAQLTFLPVKYPYCVLCRLLSSIQYPNIEEIYINVSVPFIWSVLSLTNYLNI